jgi:hypothetical protein
MSADAVPSCGWFLPNEPFTSNEDDQIFAAYSERKQITHVLLAKGKELVDFGNFIDLVSTLTSPHELSIHHIHAMVIINPSLLIYSSNL